MDKSSYPSVNYRVGFEREFLGRDYTILVNLKGSIVLASHRHRAIAKVFYPHF